MSGATDSQLICNLRLFGIKDFQTVYLAPSQKNSLAKMLDLKEETGFGQQTTVLTGHLVRDHCKISFPETSPACSAQHLN
ncbi:MAG: hypothetical protein KDF65_13825 [Anaerolineae bacterium]|nr:hypothetical protein [Anaerolineae bacterium]